MICVGLPQAAVGLGARLSCWPPAAGLWARRAQWAALVWACTWGCGSTEPVASPGLDMGAQASCAQFCNIVWRHCRGQWRVYQTLEACHSTCATWPDRPSGLMGQGNSLQCRLLYAASAIHAQDEASYCLNADASGGQMCHD